MDKRSPKNPIKYFISSLCAVLISSYIIYHLVLSFGAGVETVTALYVTQEQKVASQGYIFRDEDIVYAQSSGITNYMCDNGDKVKSGSLLANVYTGSADSSVETKLLEIDRKIELLTQSSRTLSYSFADTSSLDADIYDNYYLIQEKLSSGELGFAMRKLDELLIGLNRRNSVIQSSIDFSAEISMLAAQKATLLSGYSGQSIPVYSKQSGYFYTGVDGYEDIFTNAALEGLSVDGFFELINASPKPLSEDAVCGKIATDFNWHIVLTLDKKQVRDYTPGAVYTLYFPYNSDLSIKMTLSRIVSENEKDEALFVFSTNVIPEGFQFLRRQTVEIVMTSYSGYRIPQSALRMLDGELGVYVQQGYMVHFKRIDVLAEIDGYYIVSASPAESESKYEPLALYDNVIIKGKQLYHGKVID